MNSGFFFMTNLPIKCEPLPSIIAFVVTRLRLLLIPGLQILMFKSLAFPNPGLFYPCTFDS